MSQWFTRTDAIQTDRGARCPRPVSAVVWKSSAPTAHAHSLWRAYRISVVPRSRSSSRSATWIGTARPARDGRDRLVRFGLMVVVAFVVLFVHHALSAIAMRAGARSGLTLTPIRLLRLVERRTARPEMIMRTHARSASSSWPRSLPHKERSRLRIAARTRRTRGEPILPSKRALRRRRRFFFFFWDAASARWRYEGERESTAAAK